MIFNGKQAVGVEFKYKDKIHKVFANQEVILAAGTIGTAKLLLLSGVGPRKHLEELKVNKEPKIIYKR